MNPRWWAWDLRLAGSLYVHRLEEIPSSSEVVMVASTYRRYAARLTLWQQLRSSPYYALFVVLGAFAWAFAVAWLILPPATN